MLCLPVPEKTQRQVNFCIIPQYSDGINPPPEGETAAEAIVCTVNDGPPKTAYTGTGQPVAIGEGDTAEKLVRQILDDNLTQAKVIGPDEKEFVSATPEAHRKGEKAYHVKAFRGSKEGTSRLTKKEEKLILQATSFSYPLASYSDSKNHWSSSLSKTSNRSHTLPSSSEPSTSTSWPAPQPATKPKKSSSQ